MDREQAEDVIAMSALEFIELLAANRLISAKVREKLERQIRESPKRVSARSVAKLLISKGQLTPDQAKQLLTTPPAPPVVPAAAKSDDEDLGLAPIDELGLKPDPTTSRDAGQDDEDDLIDIEEDDRAAIPVVEPLIEADEPLAQEGGAGDWHEEGLTQTLEAVEDHAELLEAASADPGTRRAPTRRPGLAGWIPWGRSAGAPRRKYTANRWDSPLMLVGGGALLLLIVIGVGLYFFLSRGTGDEAFAAARELYRQQSYGQAINGFQQFLNDYPDHPQASAARVHIGMARIWNRVERKQWQEALGAVESELPPLVEQEAFAEARPELASLLPEITEGFADQALSAEDITASQELLSRAQDALAHVNNSVYLPTSVRRGQQARIEQIVGKLESVKRRINRDRELEKTVAEIREAAGQQKIATAYELRKTLLTTYPALEGDKRLGEAVGEITSSERAAVQPLDSAPQPLSGESPRGPLFSIALANRRGGTLSDVGDQVLAVGAQGAVYGVRAADGEVLWRRAVGHGSDNVPIVSTIGSAQAVFVVDRRSRELVRLDAQTGKSQWRLPCPGEPAQPQFRNNRLWLACRDGDRGHVMAVDPSNGQVVGGVTLPVPVSVAPTLDAENGRLIQPASHSSVYVFSTEDWSCLGVAYLGHAAETINVPAILVAGTIVIAENPGIDFSLLHVLKYGAEEPGRLEALAPPMRIDGQTIVPPHTFGRRILLATDRGSIHVLELDTNQATSPLRVAASATATVPSGTASYFLLDEGRLWVGDVQLTGYEVQTARGQLVRKWLNSKGDRFVAPLQRSGSALFHLRQRSGRAGLTLAAVHIGPEQGGKREGEAIWEVDLGVPAAGEPFIQRAAQEICVISGNGDLFAAGRDAIRAGRVNGARQQAQDPKLPPLVGTLVIDDQRRIACPRPGADRVLAVDLSSSEPTLKTVVLDLNGENIGAMPVAFQQKLAVPTAAGAVYLVDPASGKPAMPPFQPAMSAGQEVVWQKPAVVSPDDELLVADKQGSLFRLAVATEPAAHLAARSQVAGDAALVAPPIVLGSTVFTVVRGAEHDVLRRSSLEQLQVRSQEDLPGRVIWGPHMAGDLALLMTDQLQVVALNESKSVIAKESLTAPLVGAPVAYEQGLVLATADGVLWHLDGKSGEVLHKQETGESLGTGPVHFSADRFIVGGADGTLHVISLSGA